MNVFNLGDFYLYPSVSQTFQPAAQRPHQTK